MLWTPIGVTVSVTAASGAGTNFISSSIAGNYGSLVSRIFNADTATQSFTLGASSVTNTKLIPLSAGQDIVVAHAGTEIYIAASSTNIRITPGVGRP